MIHAHQISVRRARRTLVDTVSLTLEPGKVSVIIGPNGAGKSTLLKTLTGEIAADSGTVLYGDRNIATLRATDLAAIRGVLPQSTHLSFPFTALEVVRMGAVAHGSLDPNRAARRALARLDLAGFDARPYNSLSGGEQQRVQFARVLAQIPTPRGASGPCAIFLDEPTASLDIGHQISVLEIARDFARGGGIVLAILHDLNLAAEFADHLAILHHGRLVREGTPLQALEDDVIADVYGIRGAVGRLPAAAVPFILPQARHESVGR
ncbi:heme ABC transporter ATP-binding protein [Rhizobium sp. AAP43]|uniref:heme ABC transporter ATP-binding protein n=1 Tax=Rhizobium sp. AAP43 TaxID=1523420 RepID=UPI0006B96EBC|nr:heme ABC transporter ATP-binding protein [Rhizobium sp. AAP43]KPF47049.1 iron ABC transporter [Rhizobium sp. AAP43]